MRSRRSFDVSLEACRKCGLRSRRLQVSCAWEVGRSLWEFCQTTGAELDLGAVQGFLQANRDSGGRLAPRELAALVPLMRADFLWGVFYSLGHAQKAVDAERGLTPDWRCHSAPLSALNRLRKISIE